MIGGNSPSNCTSTTAPITWVTRPSKALAPPVAAKPLACFTPFAKSRVKQTGCWLMFIMPRLCPLLIAGPPNETKGRESLDEARRRRQVILIHFDVGFAALEAWCSREKTPQTWDYESFNGFLSKQHSCMSCTHPRYFFWLIACLLIYIYYILLLLLYLLLLTIIIWYY